MATSIIQTSFAAGELSPTLFARVDLAKYRQGAAVMRNFFVDYRSGASTRMGTKFVIQVYKPTLPARLIPFQTSVLVPYILEFGDFYMRPSSFGAAVLETLFNITNATQTNPVVITAAGHNFNIGDWVFVQNVQGMIQLNGRFFLVSGTSGNQVSLSQLDGVGTNGALYDPYFLGGSVGRVFTTASPYAALDLALLKYVQVANVMYLTHPNYPPYTLTFLSPTNWVFAQIVFGTTVGVPTAVVATPSAAGTVNYAYQVTAVDAAGQESDHAQSPNITSVNIGTTAGTIRVTWTAPAGGASGYNIYKAEPSYSGAIPSGAAFGFIGSANGGIFDDTNIVPDFATSPPVLDNPFAGGNNPGCACFFQQRLYYGGSNAFPQTFWASQPGFYNNFNISDPVQEDDAITGTLVSFQVNFIKAMVPMPGGLVIFTAKGAWQLSAGGGLGTNAAVTPINATSTPQGYTGASDVPPIIFNQDILFIQAKGAIVRDLTYNIYANIYSGTDISVMSNHLFFGYQIPQWAFAEEPYKVVWAVRSDGAMLSLTFIKEQEIWGWARHDTKGQFKSVATVTENQTDAVYVIVQRFFMGKATQLVERMADRIFPYGAEDAWCVDCGAQSALFFPMANLFCSNSTGNVTFATDAPVFSPASMGQIIRMGGGIATITQYLTATQVMATITQPITQVQPDDPNHLIFPAAVGTWSMTPQFSTFFGLDYLEGQLVSILADGNVITPQTVVNGSITLAQPASKVTVGLGFMAQLKTLYLDLGNEMDTVQGKRKAITAVSLRVNETRGLSYGRSFDSLSPIKEFSQGMVLGQTIPLVSFDERVVMDPLWDVPGQICIQQDNPLPATVLGIIPEITIGDDQK